MYLIIIGAGEIGTHLTELALEAKHDVVVIEIDPERAERTARNHDARVLNADIADESVLDEAEAKRADALVATTSDDSTNLMAVVLARDYGIKQVVSVVNHNSHRRLFERLGVQVLLDPERLIAQHLLNLTRRPVPANPAPSPVPPATTDDA